jgi:hypothetical protein
MNEDFFTKNVVVKMEITIKEKERWFYETYAF